MNYMTAPGLKIRKGELMAIIRRRRPSRVVSDIKEAICRYYDAEQGEVYVPVTKSDSTLAEIKQLTCFFLRKHTKLSHKKIAESVGLVDHSSCIYSIKMTENKLKNEPDFIHVINAVEAKFL